jgi:hypothetical protein
MKRRPPRGTLPVYACPAPKEGAPLGHAVGSAVLEPDGTLVVHLRALPLDGVLRVPGLAPLLAFRTEERDVP